MVGHDMKSNNDCVFRSASAMTADLSKFDTESGKKYGDPLGDPVCVCGFEKALSARQLIEFDDQVRPVMVFIEQLSTRQLVYI